MMQLRLQTLSASSCASFALRITVKRLLVPVRDLVSTPQSGFPQRKFVGLIFTNVVVGANLWFCGFGSCGSATRF
jgi:hypothetical protein